MNRYLAIVYVILLLLVSAGVQATTFKIATIAPDGTTWMKEMRAGAEEIQKRTDGRVKFRFFPGGIMGNDKSVLRKIRIGQLQGGAFTGGGLADISPDSQIYTLPLAFRSLDEVDYVRQQLDPLVIEDLYNKGYVSFGLSGGGFAYLMSDRPLRKVDDLKGQDVWVPEGDRISRAGFNAIGVTPIPLPLPDVLTGLQTGMVNTVASSSMGAIAFQWHTRVKYMTNMPLTYLFGTLLIKRKAFEKLSPEDQAVVQEVMGRIARKLDTQNNQDNDKAREALERQGIVFVETAPADLAEWEALTGRAMDELARDGVFSEAMLERLRRHVADYRLRRCRESL